MGLASKIVGAVAKRLPAHGKDRAEELLFSRRPFERLQLPRPSAFTVVCDDGETKDLEIVEVLERHGVKGVFAVSPDLIGRPGFLTYDELRQIRAAGHEIAFHGTTHDPFTSFADGARLKAAIGEGLAAMAEGGLGTPSTLIYPYGRNNRQVRSTVAPTFSSAFTTWFGINEAEVNRYAIRRIPFGAYTGKLPATEDWYRQLIDRSASAACWPTLMLHPAAEGHTKEHNALLSRLVEHAQQCGVAVRTVAAHMPIGAATSGAAPAAASGTSAPAGGAVTSLAGAASDMDGKRA